MSKRKARGKRGAASPPGPTAFELALRQGDVDALRSAVLAMEEPERELLEERLGAETVQRMQRVARRSRAGQRSGRVVVLHGIMGGLLDTIDRGGDRDRVWLNYARLALGRIRDLELSKTGGRLPDKPEVAVAGLFPEYAELLLELGRTWHVLPFAYDWRLDVDHSADQLAEAIRIFARGEPAHVVAHSMGGLVARRMASRHPDLWRSMDDRSGRSLGGRLVMLGTPNRGSFAIPLVLTGEEGVVKKLAMLDLTHSRKKLVRYLRGFTGSYQMLPSPEIDVGDDRKALFDASRWGEHPVTGELLARGRVFQHELAEVIDPDRLIYVAGYGEETPHRIRIRAPGRFEYQTTDCGDGRVPHELGLLNGVRTFYVKAKHGDLAGDSRVLGALEEILRQGTTDALEHVAPVQRAKRAAVWRQPAEVVPLEAEFLTFVPSRRGRRRAPTAAEAERLAALVVSEFVHSPREEEPAITREELEKRKAPAAKLRVQVICGDITRVPGEVYAVGHYINVLPQFAERALDRVLSPRGASDEEGLLHGLTRRGLIRGEVGEVLFFPWHDKRKRKLVAVAGMGHPGTFGRASLRRLGHNLALSVAALKDVREITSVLIGSGTGNLSTEDAVRCLMWGVADAASTSRVPVHMVLRLVDLDRKKADAILDALRELSKDESFAERLTLTLPPRVSASAKRPSARPRQATKAGSSMPVPARLCWTQDGHSLRASALTSTAVVPERTLRVDLSLVDELVERMIDPPHEDTARHGSLLGRLIVPIDFRQHVRDVAAQRGAVVIEVDRYAAGIHWEMLSIAGQPEESSLAIGLTAALARQLRTAYAPSPALADLSSRALRALVVGDPGDPRKSDDLPGAREEALLVKEWLERRGVEVQALIGAPSVARRGALRGIPPAARLDVLDLLTRGGFDLLHYSGHGDFDPDTPERVGWLFEGGLLTSGELAQMELAPRLIVANACLSARTSNRLQRVRRSSDQRSEADLLPSLADEFFRRGVRNYIGTAWEVDDAGAVEFARSLYDALLPERAGKPGETIGEAVLQARLALHEKWKQFDALWAAYQHYGDPQERLSASRA